MPVYLRNLDSSVDGKSSDKEKTFELPHVDTITVAAGSLPVEAVCTGTGPTLFLGHPCQTQVPGTPAIRAGPHLVHICDVQDSTRAFVHHTSQPLALVMRRQQHQVRQTHLWRLCGLYCQSP